LIIARKIQMLYFQNTSKEIQKLALCAAKSFQLLGGRDFAPDPWSGALSYWS